MRTLRLKGAVEPLRFETSLPQAIATARTRADLEQLALRFEQEANALQEQSKQHRAAIVSYEAMSYAGMQRDCVIQEHDDGALSPTR